MKRFAWFVLSSCVSIALPVHAAVFCVDTSVELRDALQAADSNQQADEIRIRPGAYTSPQAGQGFKYESAANEAFDLSVSGDWHPFFNNSCGVQGDDPFATTIDGNNATKALQLLVKPAGNVNVRLLTFLDGYSVNSGAGLEIQTVGGNNSPNAVIDIERNVFLLNESDSCSGLRLNSGLVQRVVNNLFLLNTGVDGIGTAACVGSINAAVYVSNNTVLSNSSAMMPNAAINARSELGVFLANNNFWDNGTYDFYLGWATGQPASIVRNNNYETAVVEGPSWVDQGNISVEPEFESGLFNFTPRRTSPLVDAGIPPTGVLTFWYLTDVDLNGVDRVVGSAVDIGAYENERIFANGFDLSGPF